MSTVSIYLSIMHTYFQILLYLFSIHIQHIFTIDLCTPCHAGVNYHLSVIPFLAAVQTGVIGDGVIKITVQGPSEGAEDYCTSFSDCSAKYPDLMSKWETFFKVKKKLLLHSSTVFWFCPKAQRSRCKCLCFV